MKEEASMKQAERRAGFLLGVLLEAEDGGSVFLRNVGRYIPEDRTLHYHRCENLKSFSSYVC
jgi:hypothetical protein